MAGYSPRSLVQKLGIKEDHKVLFVQPPADYAKTLGPLPASLEPRNVSVTQARAKTLAKAAPFDFIQVFCGDAAELASLLPALKGLLAMDGMLWVSWRKKTPKAPDATAKRGVAEGGATKKTSAAKGGAKSAGTKVPAAEALGENQVRKSGLDTGLVDVKVCAVDETWSGLKFMYRLKDRA